MSAEAMGTRAWATDRTQQIPIVTPRRPSAVRLIGASVGAIGARVARRSRTVAGDVVDLVAFGAFTYGAFQLPGSWGEVGGWAVAGLSLLITGAKLNP